MCFVSNDRPETTDPERGAEQAQQDEMTRRRRARGYGATLLNDPAGFDAAQLGRATLGGR